MMRITATIALAGMIGLFLAACESAGGVPDSSIYIVDSDTTRIISTPRTQGELTLAQGEVFNFRIERLTSEGNDTQTSNVTTVATYSFIPDGIALANTLGELRAVSPGTTRLEVRFRPSNLDSADRVYLDLTVTP